MVLQARLPDNRLALQPAWQATTWAQQCLLTSRLELVLCARWLQAREHIWQADDGEAAPMALQPGHPDEKLLLHATESLAPGALHQLKAAAVSP